MQWLDQHVYRLLADLVLVAHLVFIVFVLFGALLALKWPAILWLHAPAAIWGALSEFLSLPCPLTPLEKHFQRLAGDTPYEGDFIAHYLMPIIYPSGLTPAIQLVLGVIVVALNLAIYGWLWSTMHRH